MSPARSLRTFLDLFDADIICLQAGAHGGYCHSVRIRILLLLHAHREERLPRLLRAHCWSGVATFCKVECGNNVALPVAAEEGFTGLLTSAKAEPDTSRNVSKPAFTQETGSRKLQRLSQSRLTGFCYQRHESSDKMSCTEVAVHGQSSSLADGIQQSPELCDNNNCSEVAACQSDGYVR
ncbi:uncharacterized protein LOC112344462 isoform X2 [Selaginella moellendorffii]|uniref:uncharacterized protein LOC112344462 isoform X2 n=1 Tax=Selaginella moellendorffii TaxID=88036 RepID=UPI000D1C86E4|nr:uncharacterized protein LOC112344462 isoform X2 [Selaginella moellendorffii]|eukprot:XP_024525068.1 uncharacterized protein LOC112344462 isoform X2 [Selaginella moellendorffii]